ncbi:hypothetical protein PRUPE_2G128100 [Prunus persica]|uniref:Uncharacterized protein n=1 Tax=Prunus persica TaxID=3760 RepID=A0A251QEZ9_PRUPE|nr:uncharacterized protein LOC18769424 isoform X1 [Prunus persica]XP_020413456.1 uncharacterized protein LOC18769424 isoform X1 [Prunus persica]ONI22426.1 hypothetical protein PRUPE_2G128100 [Prunus persica]ONI22427.1 hypothetical protein PRUPE_2G128100 [Prunus persica]
MGPELEVKPKSGAAMEVSVAKDGTTHHDVVVDDKFMPCVSNYKDNILEMEETLVGQTTVSNKRENAELNRTGGTSPDDVQILEGECGDLTENSSSFGDTISGTEDGSTLDGDEADSQLGENEHASVYDGYFGAFQTRKKKLTPEWRNFIRPEMWRLKWLELQIKELLSQTQKYDSELAKYDKEKLSAFEGFTSEGFDAMPTPKLMKRKKRKRVEDTTDIASYMSHHNLFSYVPESKKTAANGVCMQEDWGDLAGGKTSYGHNEFETNDIWSSLEFRDGNSSLEDILWKIEVVHSQVWQLKTRIDKVVQENPGNFSANHFLVPCDTSNGSAQNPASPPENGNTLLVETLSTASQHVKFNIGNLFLPQSAVSSHEELTPLPGMIGNTDQPWLGNVLENVEDGCLIPNAAVKDEPYNFEVKDQLIQKPHISLEEQETNFPVPVSETELPTNLPVPVSETALPTSSSVPNATHESDSTTRTNFRWNTRNRGRRKPGSYAYKLSRKS